MSYLDIPATSPLAFTGLPLLSLSVDQVALISSTTASPTGLALDDIFHWAEYEADEVMETEHEPPVSNEAVASSTLQEVPATTATAVSNGSSLDTLLLGFKQPIPAIEAQQKQPPVKEPFLTSATFLNRVELDSTNLKDANSALKNRVVKALPKTVSYGRRTKAASTPSAAPAPPITPTKGVKRALDEADQVSPGSLAGSSAKRARAIPMRSFLGEPVAPKVAYPAVASSDLTPSSSSSSNKSGCSSSDAYSTAPTVGSPCSSPSPCASVRSLSPPPRPTRPLNLGAPSYPAHLAFLLQSAPAPTFLIPHPTCRIHGAHARGAPLLGSTSPLPGSPSPFTNSTSPSPPPSPLARLAPRKGSLAHILN
ncbi:hypothetical protein JCM9279_004168 [Rhodotorula babjevae]